MTDWSARSFCNVVYAFLAESLAGDDRFALPLFMSVGVKSEEVEAMSKRDSLDSWLEGPSAEVARQEVALQKYLTT